MHSTQHGDVAANSSEPGLGKVILKDALMIVIASGAIIAFYFLVKAFSIIANLP
jgi:hypothetical protein